MDLLDNTSSAAGSKSDTDSGTEMASSLPLGGQLSQYLT